MNTKFTDKQRKQILILRDKDALDFSEICKIMKLSQRVARNLYMNSKNKFLQQEKEVKRTK